MSNLTLKKATRKQVKLRLGLAGPSGSGKTASALLLAYGIVGDWSKIAVIDSENESASLYANFVLPNCSTIGEFNTISISAPFSPEKYIEAIKACEAVPDIEIIIVDSITQEWAGKGGCLDIHEDITKRMKNPNSYTAWAEVTPRHQSFIDTILQSRCHVITTVRSKTEYVMTERNGKQVPQKMGMASVTREGFEYELSVSLDIDITNKAYASKDRTGLFSGKLPFVVTEETGRAILEWCMRGEIVHHSVATPATNTIDELELQKAIRDMELCSTLADLQNTWTTNKAYQRVQSYVDAKDKRKEELDAK